MRVIGVACITCGGACGQTRSRDESGYGSQRKPSQSPCGQWRETESGDNFVGSRQGLRQISTRTKINPSSLLCWYLRVNLIILFILIRSYHLNNVLDFSPPTFFPVHSFPSARLKKKKHFRVWWTHKHGDDVNKNSNHFFFHKMLPRSRS